MSKEFFPQRPDSNPTIYAYEDSNPQYAGLLKVGFTNIDMQTRVAQQYPTKRQGKLPYKIVFETSSMRKNGSTFTDHPVHRQLRKAGIPNPEGEWFRCTVDDIKAAVFAVKTGKEYEPERVCNFTMRPEQKEAITQTMNYYQSFKKEGPDRTPRFLWNAKMRFGKTFTAYKRAAKNGMEKSFGAHF